jgi:thioredoxin reductase (NADPH)
MKAIDLIIVGAGPAGLSCAIEAKKAGISCLILERGMLVDSIYRFPTNMTFFSTSKLLEIGDVPFISHSDKPTRREALEYYRRVVDSYQLQINFYEPVDLISQNDSEFVITTNKEIYNSKFLVISTGFFGCPKLLGVPGEDLLKVKHYYDEAHPYVGQKLLVIGAANSACDVALETWYKGAEVTMAVREDSIYKGVKYWIRPNIENRIKEGAINAYFNTQVVSIHKKHVVLNQQGKIFDIENDYVLAMTGYKPDYSQFKKWGMAIEPTDEQAPVHNPETLETSIPNMYIAGVINAGLNTSKLFIENTRHHGKQIISDILLKNQ